MLTTVDFHFTMNKYELFQRVAPARDFPEKSLRRGDVATIVDCHPDLNGSDLVIRSKFSMPSAKRLR